MNSRTSLLVAALALTTMAAGPVAAQDLPARPAGLNLIPWPKAVTPAEGEMTLSATSRIVATDASLAALADILAREIQMISGLRLATATDAGKPGDIVLKIDATLKAERDILTVQQQKVCYTRDYAHTLTITQQALVTGFDYRAVAEGTSTLLQALRRKDGRVTLPCMTVKDWPQADFMAVMIDVGRQYIPIAALKQSIESCRLYKVRYLQLHLSDDQGFTFPSTAFPKLGSRNTAAHGGIAPKVYDLQALKDLVAFADARGVTLVPELETPGHSGAIRLAMPELFDSPKEPGGAAWIAVMNLANEKMYPALDTLVDEISAVFKSSPYFHMGCDECRFNILETLPQTQEYLKAHNMKGVGELYVQHILRVNQSIRKRGKTTIVWEGAALDADKMKDQILVETWDSNSNAAAAYQKLGFTTITVPWTLGVPVEQWTMYLCNGSVLKPTDKVLGALLPMWEMNEADLISGYLKGIPVRQERTWGPDNAYAVKEFATRSAQTETLREQLILPVRYQAAGLDKPEESVFYKEATITLSSSVAGGAIHYTTDGSEPTAASPKYQTPVALKATGALNAALFGADGKQLGFAVSKRYTWINHETSLTTGKPVTASAIEAANVAQNAVDGEVRLGKAWWAAPTPQWLQVDLQREFQLGKVTVIPFWDGNRSYQYTVEVSTDGKTWTQVADMSDNTTPGTDKGYTHEFKPTPGRYVKINVLKNSSNPGAHLVEVHAYEAQK